MKLLTARALDRQAYSYPPRRVVASCRACLFLAGEPPNDAPATSLQTLPDQTQLLPPGT